MNPIAKMQQSEYGIAKGLGKPPPPLVRIIIGRSWNKLRGA